MASPSFRAAVPAAQHPVEIAVDGRKVMAPDGQMLAAALLAIGAERFGALCLMGTCFQCLVTIDGRSNRRACRTAVAAGLRVTT